MWTFASRRWPTMPMASRMLSCASSENSCGRTCSTSRSSGSDTPRAASMARRTSSRWMSRGRAPSVIPPRLFTPRTCPPATPIMADSTGTPTIVSASSMARRMELTARSRLTIWPLRQPLDSAAPRAANFTLPSSSISPISAQVLVLPMSSATMCRSFFVKSAPRDSNALSPRFFRRLRAGQSWQALLRHGGGILIDHRLTVEPQVHRLDWPRLGAPLADILDKRLILSGEVGIAKMHEDGRVGTAESRQSGAHVVAIGKIHFADLIERAGARRFDLLCKSGIELHALLAVLQRHFRTDSRHDRKMENPFE